MPYLTSGRGRPAARAHRLPLRLAAPGFGHPLLAPAEWSRLARPGLPLDWAVVGGSPAGPGSRPDAYWSAVVLPLRAAGVRVLGRLDFAFGARPFGELLSDAQRYLNWYRVDGFAVARCPMDAEALAEVRRLTGALRTLLVNAHLVLVHGRYPVPGYAALADQLVTFTGPWSRYRHSREPQWAAEHPPGRFCHLVHSLPGDRLAEALALARAQRAGTVYLTDRTDAAGVSPWEPVPGYWDELVSRLGPGVSE
ncbi:spherulation-specific family 4 protein [Streptomyces orinoci]|uniref:Spherulation-specific family 4 protein n=1 Tax=Streptomyces orinoci TaxID=67339 RepID=A0ABV3JST0_STRON|nr:spherulation-specific family 4 protein [Streptomyces orinoci]